MALSRSSAPTSGCILTASFGLFIGCGSPSTAGSGDAPTSDPVVTSVPTASAPTVASSSSGASPNSTAAPNGTLPVPETPPPGSATSTAPPVNGPSEVPAAVGGSGGEPATTPGGAGMNGQPSAEPTAEGGNGGVGGATPTVETGGQPAAVGGNAGSEPTASGGATAGNAGMGTAGSMNLAGAGAGGAVNNECENGKVVHFVYFVEADQPYSESQHADIERQAFAFQEYWYEQLGVTFYLNQPVVDVIEADHDAAWYLETPDGIHGDSRWYRLGNVKNEVQAKLGFGDFDDNHRVVNYPTTRHDGRVGGNFGGAWMDGDDLTCIADDGPTYPYDDGAVAHCMGHPAHEFGHVLGLDHEGPNDDCMLYGFYTSTVSGMCTFSEANVQKILANPNNEGWFEAVPGETCTGN